MTAVQRQSAAPTLPNAALFSSAAIASHTLLFTPLVGALMVFLNWARLGNVSRGMASGGIGLLALAGLGAFGWLVSPLATSVGLVAGILGLALGWYSEQRALNQAHQQAGGRRAPPWPATVAGLVVWALAAAAWLVVS